MLHTLYSRLVSTHLLVAVVALSLVGVLSSALFRGYYVAQTQRSLSQAAEDLSKTLARVMLQEDSQDSIRLLTHTASESLGGRVCVFGCGESDLVATSDLKRSSVPGQEDLACVAKASADVDRTRALCYPGPVISVVCPITKPRTGERLGVLLLRRPLHEVEATLRAVTYLTAGSGVLAAALALLLAFLVSRAVAHPLSDMAKAASDLAEGDFSARVVRQGPMELRTVAASLNHMATALSEAFAELSGERERLADILTSMEEGVLGLDSDGRVTVANHGAARLLRDGGEDLVGKPFDELLGDDETRADLQELLSGSSDSFHRTIRIADRALRLHGARVRTQEGGAVLVITDVTEANRLERMRREFVANASHELRAPLTSIQGFIGAVADGTAQTHQEKQRCLRIAAEQAALMRRLVDQLLDLSRLQARQAPLEREQLDLARIVRAAVDAMSVQAAAKSVTLTTDIGDVPPVTGDGDRLLQVLVNLVNNAIRFSPSNSRITISARAGASGVGGDVAQAASGGAGVTVSVRDHGPGIPAEDLPLIWERFHKADRARQRTDPGTGLGLAIAKEIVLAHSGHVEAANAPDGGAIFTIRLPVA